jgi:lycopene beta-cyclase
LSNSKFQKKYFEIAIAGGGLSGALLAVTLKILRPEIKVSVVDQAETLGGGHTWSFHEGDLSSILNPKDRGNSDRFEQLTQAIKSLITTSWPKYEVLFGEDSRCFERPYHSVQGQNLEPWLRRYLDSPDLELGKEIERLNYGSINYTDGSQKKVDLVIDARGFGKPMQSAGYQKFVGQFITTQKPHGLDHVILMDARCEQRDGFRFIYVLPWGERQLLIEDTRYSNSASIDTAAFTRDIADYATKHGWHIASIERQESAALPIPLLSEPMPMTTIPARIGVGAGLFHPTTGYSFGEALRFAIWFAAQDLQNTDLTYAAMHDYQRRFWRRTKFLRRLNNMMFLAAAPEQRVRIMEQFYKRSQSLIERFYANQLTSSDCLRLVMGKPPVALRSGIESFFGRSL